MSESRIDLDDMSRCPVDEVCAACGAREDLAVSTLDTSLGVICQTVCDGCAADLKLLLSPAAAAGLVLGHCAHLGIDVDQMAEIRRADREGSR